MHGSRYAQFFFCATPICDTATGVQGFHRNFESRTYGNLLCVLVQWKMVVTGGTASPHSSPVPHINRDRQAAFRSPTSSPCSVGLRKECNKGVWSTLHGVARLGSQRKLNFTQASFDWSAGLSRARTSPQSYQGMLSGLSSDPSQGPASLWSSSPSNTFPNGVGSVDLTGPDIIGILRNVLSLKNAGGIAAELIKALSNAASSSATSDAAIVTLCAIAQLVGHHRLSTPARTALLLALLDVVGQAPPQGISRPSFSLAQPLQETMANISPNRSCQDADQCQDAAGSSLDTLRAWAHAAVQRLTASQSGTPNSSPALTPGAASPSRSPSISSSDTVSLSEECIGSPASIAESSAARVRLACSNVAAAESTRHEGPVEALLHSLPRFGHQTTTAASATLAPLQGAEIGEANSLHEALAFELAVLVRKAKTAPGHAEAFAGERWAMAALAAGHLVAKDTLLEPPFEMHSASEVYIPSTFLPHVCKQIPGLQMGVIAFLLFGQASLQLRRHQQIILLSGKNAKTYIMRSFLSVSLFALISARLP
jgi:hypothetical protein